MESEKVNAQLLDQVQSKQEPESLVQFLYKELDKEFHKRINDEKTGLSFDAYKLIFRMRWRIREALTPIEPPPPESQISSESDDESNLPNK